MDSLGVGVRNNDNHYRGVSSRVQRRRGKTRRVLGWVSAAMAGVLVIASLSAYAVYRDLQGNITRKSVDGKLGKNRPDDVSEAKNILLIGSDTRKGKNSEYGAHVQGARSDTLILLHLSPGHDKAMLMSFPRDTLVQIPQCHTRDGGIRPPHVGMMNSAFTIGGPACSWKTVEQLTDIRIDHFVQIDFAGFKRMVNALGGIEICLPKPVHDPKSGLDLNAGRHVVRGEQALAYVRVRHGLGNGGDLDRIDRQKKFLAAMVRKATSKKILLDPQKLYKFLNAATNSVTTDDTLSVNDMRRLALSVKGISTGNVSFLTIPVGQHPLNPNRLKLRQPQANRLFAAVRNDKPPKKKKTPTAEESPTPTLPPAQVRVRVLNGTSIPGLASEAAAQLRSRGFQVLGVGNADTQNHKQSLIRYGSSSTRGAATIAEMVPEAKKKRAPARAGSGGAVALVLGRQWSGLSSPGDGGGDGAKPTPTAIPTGVETLKASQDTCGG